MTPLAPVLLLVTTLTSTVHARPDFVAKIPNGDGLGGAHALGHIAWDGGGPLNPFGKAFAAAGFVWSRSLCEGDADGDGQTNGEELGDPCCLWTPGTTPLIRDVLSHPGDYGSKLNATELRLRHFVCQALDHASTSRVPLFDGSSSAAFDASGDNESPAEWDLSSKHPPAPPQTGAAASSYSLPALLPLVITGLTLSLNV